MRIAIGMIVRDILSAHPLTDFLDNAEKHGHALDRVIIVYSHQADPGAVEELRSRTNLSLIKLQSNERAHLIMKEIGVRHSSIHQLLYCPLIDAHGLIPYGFNRNQALMEAMFTGTDYLIFVDSDVRPEVLRKTPDGAVQSEEIDFIGAHLHGLSLGADVTSSDYSGYNILPPASFDGMKDLLWGLHKESMADFWQNSEAHRGLVIQEDQNAEPQPTTKVLGGNLGIRMSALTTLPPFSPPTISTTGRRFLPGEKIPSWEWPRPRAISDVWTSRHLSSMTPTEIIPRFRISGMTAVSGTGSTMPVPAGSGAMYFSAGRPDIPPLSLPRETASWQQAQRHWPAIPTTGGFCIFRIFSLRRNRGCRI